MIDVKFNVSFSLEIIRVIHLNNWLWTLVFLRNRSHWLECYKYEWLYYFTFLCLIVEAFVLSGLWMLLQSRLNRKSHRLFFIFWFLCSPDLILIIEFNYLLKPLSSCLSMKCLWTHQMAAQGLHFLRYWISLLSHYKGSSLIWESNLLKTRSLRLLLHLFFLIFDSLIQN